MLITEYLFIIIVDKMLLHDALQLVYEGGPAVKINKMIPSSKYEETVFDIRHRKLQQRKIKSTNKKSNNNNNDKEENDVLSSLVDRGNAIIDMPALAHSNAILMSLTTLENCFICQPQNVNMAGSVFGGFLMHKAYDVALGISFNVMIVML